MAVYDRLRHMLRDRWLGLVVGMWMQACGGISYTFSLYSADMKAQLGYNQEMVDALGTSKDIGGNVGIVSGLLIDVVPPSLILLVGAAMHLLGYSMVSHSTLPPLFRKALLAGLGMGICNCSCTWHRLGESRPPSGRSALLCTSAPPFGHGGDSDSGGCDADVCVHHAGNKRGHVVQHSSASHLVSGMGGMGRMETRFPLPHSHLVWVGQHPKLSR